MTVNAHCRSPLPTAYAAPHSSGNLNRRRLSALRVPLSARPASPIGFPSFWHQPARHALYSPGPPPPDATCLCPCSG